VHPADNLDHAAELMRDRDCGSVVVVDENNVAVGIVTDRDICMAALRYERPLLSLSVADAMTAEPFTCRGTDTVQEAEDTMSLHQVRRLPVVDDHKRLLGLLALDDIAREACREVWVFERGARQRPGDLGEQHMEELIPHAEVVAITATTLSNGTLDGVIRLLGAEAFVVMLGPSTPYATSLFEAGFDALCGTVVVDDEAVVRAVSQGAVTGQITGVRRMCLFREDTA